MTIILLDHDKLKICLSREEMSGLGLDESRLDYRDPNIKGVLISLLQKARTEAGFHPRGAKVIVEILPDETGGCVLCFTAVHGLRLSPGGGVIEPAVYAFDNACDLLSAIGGLYTRFAHRIHQSALYEWKGRFLLIVRALDYNDKQSASFLAEYARLIGTGEVLAAHIDEHGRLLAAENAVDHIGAILCAKDSGQKDMGRGRGSGKALDRSIL